MLRFLLLLCCALFFFSPVQAKAGKIKITWMTDLPAAIKLAKKTKKKVFVAFCSKWCVKCKKMEKIVCGDQKIAAYLKQHFVTVKINIDYQPKIAEKYGVSLLPVFPIPLMAYGDRFDNGPWAYAVGFFIQGGMGAQFDSYDVLGFGNQYIRYRLSTVF